MIVLHGQRVLMTWTAIVAPANDCASCAVLAAANDTDDAPGAA